MKIMLLGINFSPEIVSTAVYSTGFADWMAEHGHQVRVFTAQPYYPGWAVFDGYPRYRYRSTQRATGIRITHCPLYVPARPTGRRRVLHHLSFAASALPRVLWHALTHRPDLVVVVAPSLVSAPVGWLASKLAGAKAWIHVQDFEVEAALATGLLPGGGQIAALARRFERWCLSRFDLASSISAPMIEKLVAKGVPEGKTVEFRNWADIGAVTPLQATSPLKAELGIETPYVALYSGNIGNKQGLEIIPETARLLAHRADLTFVICGEGPALADLRARAEGLGNVAFFPLQPREQLGALLGMADIHLLPQIAGAADLVLPSKLANMLASGRPVIATAPAGTALAAEVEGAGQVMPPGDAPALAAAIGALLDAPERRREQGKVARERAMDRWDGDVILTRMEARLADLIVSTAPSTGASMEET